MLCPRVSVVENAPARAGVPSISSVSGHLQADEQGRVNDKEIESYVALAAAQPALLHSYFIGRVQQPDHPTAVVRLRAHRPTPSSTRPIPAAKKGAR
jgi:hypothetical protein